MPNWCHNVLAVVGDESELAQFGSLWKDGLDTKCLRTQLLKSADGEILVSFDTRWDPGVDEVKQLSAKFTQLDFLLSYSEPMGGFRGLVVVKNGRAVEWVHRLYGYNDAKLYDRTHPLVDIFANYRKSK